MCGKTILILANDTTYTYNLRDLTIKTLNDAGYRITIAAERLCHANELEEMGCRIISLRIGRRGTNPFADMGLFFSYLKMIGTEKPDAVLAFNIKPDIYGGLACRRKKVPFFPNITGLGTALEYPGRIQKITKTLYRAGLKDARCVFFQNSENKAFFQSNNLLTEQTDMVLLPGSGVNLEKHALLPFPNDTERIRFLYVARIMKEKGIDLFLAAAKKLYKRAEFHICGYCDDTGYLEVLSNLQKQGILFYHGEQNDMTPMFEMAHCVVHPSWYPEGMSNVLLEAAAHGRPIITSDRSGCRETVEDGITGYQIPICDEAALIDAIERFLRLSQDERIAMGQSGRRKMEKEFDRKIVAEEYRKRIERKRTGS